MTTPKDNQVMRIASTAIGIIDDTVAMLRKGALSEDGAMIAAIGLAMAAEKLRAKLEEATQ